MDGFCAAERCQRLKYQIAPAQNSTLTLSSTSALSM